jgi:hypothetical protein
VAWVENKTWELEQGIDGRLELKLWADTAKTTPWSFTGWTLYGFVSDSKRSEIYALDLSGSNATTGSIVAILPEATVNSLKVGREWFYDLLAVAPGSVLADDTHIAFGPALPTFRPARRAS